MNARIVDIRKIDWRPLFLGELLNALKLQWEFIRDPERLQETVGRLIDAARPDATKPQMQSCLAPVKAPLSCKDPFNPEDIKRKGEFIQKLHAELTRLACESPDIARGILWQIQKHDEDSTREGLEVQLKRRLDDPNCPGLQGLRSDEKEELERL